MPRVYELPTHLQVEDQLIAGLTARQLLRLMIGASLAYGAYDQLAWLPDEVRVALVGALAIGGILFALLQPRGRCLDAWLLAAALFVALPRQLVWRPGSAQYKPRPDQTGWAELELEPQWADTETDRQLVVSDSPSGHSRLTRLGLRRLTRRRRLW